jgi:hypothetical protein
LRGKTVARETCNARRADIFEAELMTAPAPDPHPDPEPFPHPEPGPANPDETPVRIIDLPPNQPSPGIPVDNPLPS